MLFAQGIEETRSERCATQQPTADGIRGKHLTGNRVGGLRSTVYGLADSLPAAPHIEDSLRLRHVPTRREC